MFVKNEGKRRCAITSVWFFVPILTFLVCSIILKFFNVISWLCITAVCLYLAFLNPNKKYGGIIYAIIAIICLLTNYEYSQISVFGAFSLSMTIDILFLTLLMGSLAILGLAQFGDHPERWLKFRFVPAVSVAALLIKLTYPIFSGLFVNGILIFSNAPLLLVSFAISIFQTIALVIAHHQLSMKFCEAARKNRKEIADEEVSSVQTDSYKKNRFQLKAVLRSVLLLVAVFIFVCTFYNCCVAAFGKDPVVTVDGETYTIVKKAPEVFTYPEEDKQEYLHELSSKYRKSWSMNILSPEIAAKYGVAILNDVFDSWTYDNRAHLKFDADEWSWAVSGELESLDNNQLTAEVVFDCTTGEILRVYTKGQYSEKSQELIVQGILDKLESFS
ncbi:MAG: hypothetical protein IJD75_07200 [Clostridia bacterium]|nr:hypothetical protein [Clostridia bacterium]